MTTFYEAIKNKAGEKGVGGYEPRVGISQIIEFFDSESCLLDQPGEQAGSEFIVLR